MASPIDIDWHGIYIVTTHREGGVGEGRCGPGQDGNKVQKSRDCRGIARGSGTCGDIDVAGV